MTSEENITPLISIIVPTYNSSAYILETLESAKAQTYRNIELIVTDDCSKDKTIELCNDWLSKNNDCFVRTAVITTPQNKGISANLNRGINNARGVWLKIIAGDDILLKDCILKNFEYATKNESSFLFSRHIWFKVDDNNKKLFNSNQKQVNEYWENLNKSFFALEAKSQYYKLLRFNRVPASTAFFYRETLISIGGFDESIPMIDDYPLWLKATKNNHKLYFLNFPTVLYRKHEDSISAHKNVKLSFVKDNYRIYKKYRINRHTIFNVFLHISVNLNYLNHMLIIKSGRYNWINKVLQFLDPYNVKRYFLTKPSLEDVLSGSFCKNEEFNKKNNL